jgi:hypothetical protein
VRGRAQPRQDGRVHHRGADPGDHVATEGLLLVEHRAHRHGSSRRQVEQRGHDGRRTEVERDREPTVGGVSGLHVDQCLVDDHRGDLVVAFSQDRRQPTQRVQVRHRGEVVDGVEQPGQVGTLVGQGRLGQLDITLLHCGPQDDLPTDADGRGLRPGHQRWHLDL